MTTIGVALAVPEPWATQLQDYRGGLGDDTASGIPTHVTLLPPIDVEDDLMPAVEEHLHAAASRCPAFRLHLRGTGSFRPVSPVVFVNVVDGIACCEVLAAAVRAGPLAVEAAFPYHPHVTVAHHLAPGLLDRAFAEMADFECVFWVGDFWLYAHDRDAGWKPTRRFALTGPGGDGEPG